MAIDDVVALLAGDGATLADLIAHEVDRQSGNLGAGAHGRLSHLSYAERELVEPLSRLGFQG